MSPIDLLSQIISAAKKVSVIDANGKVSTITVVTLVDVLKAAEQVAEEHDSKTAEQKASLLARRGVNEASNFNKLDRRFK